MKKIFFLIIFVLCNTSTLASEKQALQPLENYFTDLFAQTRFGSRKIEADFDIIDAFIETNNIDPNVKLTFGETIFSCLCQLNDSESIIKFIEKYNPNIADDTNDLLRDAIKWDTTVDFVRMLIGYGVPIDGENKGGALVKASIHNHKEIVKLLLDHGAQQGRNEALVSVSGSPRYKDILALLLIYGADANYSTERYSCLTRAVDDNDIQNIQLLLERGADVNFANHYGYTILMRAVVRNDIEIVASLLDYGADIDFVNKEGKTALMIANEYKNDEMIQLLQKYRERLNV